VSIEPGHCFELAQVPNDDGTVQISYTLPEDAENVFVGLWNKFSSVCWSARRRRPEEGERSSGTGKTIREIPRAQASLSAGCAQAAGREPASLSSYRVRSNPTLSNFRLAR